MATATDDNAADEKSDKSIWQLLNIRCTRACLKKAFCKMYVTIRGRFRPDEGAVAGYGNRIRVKYTAKWGVQIAGMLFQTHSSFAYKKVPRETFLANSNSYDTLYKLSVFSFSISCFSYIFSTYLLVKARITAK